MEVSGKVPTFALAFEKHTPQRRGGQVETLEIIGWFGRLENNRKKLPKNLQESKIGCTFAKFSDKNFEKATEHIERITIEWK